MNQTENEDPENAEDIGCISAVPDDDILLSRNSIVWCDDVERVGESSS